MSTIVRIVDAMTYRDGGTISIAVELESGIVHLRLDPPSLADASEPRITFRSERLLGKDHRLVPAGEEEQAWVQAIRAHMQAPVSVAALQSNGEDRSTYVQAFLQAIAGCPVRRTRLGLPPLRASTLKYELAWTLENIEKIVLAYLAENDDIPTAVIYELVNDGADIVEIEAREQLIERLRDEHAKLHGRPLPVRVRWLLGHKE